MSYLPWTVRTQHGVLQSFDNEMTALDFAVRLGSQHKDLVFQVLYMGEVRHALKVLEYPNVQFETTDKTLHNRLLLNKLGDNPRPEEIN